MWGIIAAKLVLIYKRKNYQANSGAFRKHIHPGKNNTLFPYSNWKDSRIILKVSGKVVSSVTLTSESFQLFWQKCFTALVNTNPSKYPQTKMLNKYFIFEQFIKLQCFLCVWYELKMFFHHQNSVYNNGGTSLKTYFWKKIMAQK